MTHKGIGTVAGKETNSRQNYSLFPNPTNGAITIEQANADGKPVAITITNLLGQTVYQNTLNFVAGMYLLQFPSSLQAGMYLVQITDGTNQRFNLKFVLE